MSTRVLAPAAVVLIAAVAVVAPATSRAQPLDVLQVLVLPAAFSAAGVVALRHSRRLPPKALIALGLLHVLAVLLACGAVVADRSGSSPGAALLAFGSGATYLLGFVALLVLALSLPAGERLSPWSARWVVALAALGVLGPAASALGEEQRLVVTLPGWPAAVAGTGLAPGVAGVGAAAALLLAAPAAAAAVVAVRWRRASGADRRRLRWAAAVLAAVLAALVVQQLLGRDLPEGAEALLGLAALGVLPFALLPAVVAGGGVDDERLASAVRVTLVLALLWTTCAVAYAALVAGVQPDAAGRARLATGVLVLAGLLPLLPPARRVVTRLADRLAHGPAVDGYALLRDHGAVVAGADGTSDVCAATAATARAALDARWVQMSLHTGESGGVAQGVPALTIPLEDADGVLGVLLVGPRRRGAYRSRDVDALHLLARQVALGVRRHRLAQQLAAQVDELEASRRRLAVAEDAERRRIERDLHDGAQQDLVALLTRVELARTLLGSSVEDAALALDELRADVRRAIASLRRTVLGIHPPVLTDQGLVAAVTTRIRDLPLDVALDVDACLRHGRFPPQVEAAAYYVVVESLTNVLKHAGVDGARVRLGRAAEALVVQVEDAGRGGADTARGTGLAGLADRVAAAGGTLEVLSPPGSGTRVQALLPVTARAAS